MPIRRRRLLGTAAGLAALSLAPRLPARAAIPALPFNAIGDWGRKGHDRQRAVADAMGADAAATGARFTVSVGDNFYENGVTGVDDPQWRESFEEIYSAPSLQKPWRTILGNHDYRGNVEAQLQYGAKDGRWHMPGRTYTVTETLGDGSQAEFFYIDTSPFIRAYRGTEVRIDGQDTAGQLRWLDTALGQSRARWKIVVGHHQIYLAGDNEGFQPSDLIPTVDPVLRRHNVPVYINGHVHTLQHVERDGIHYVTTGAGSKTDRHVAASVPGGFASGEHGFMRCALSPDNLDFAFVTTRGDAIFTKSIARV